MQRNLDRVRLANLRLLIGEAGSADALARATGTSGAYLSQIRSGTPYKSGRSRRMGDNLAAKLERATGKPLGWMDEAHPAGSAPRAAAPAGEPSSWSPGGLCPLISWLQAGAWTEAPAFPNAEARINCPVRCGPDTFVLRVRGESMEPQFREGDLIFVDPGVAPGNRSYVVVRRGDGSGTATFKQLIEEDGRRYLKAANPHWPRPIVEADADAAVCGVVVFRGSAVPDGVNARSAGPSG